MTRYFVGMLALVVAGCDDSKGLCGSGTRLEDGVCVALVVVPCPVGQSLVGDQCRRALECGQGTTEVNGQCHAMAGIVCTTGTKLVGTECVPDLTKVCSTDTSASVNVCVSALRCGAGTTRSGGECTSATGATTCGVGTMMVGNECRPSASLTCGSGTTQVGNECRATPGGVTCGSGTSLSGSQCVANLMCGTGTSLSSTSCIVNLTQVCSTDTTGAGGNRCVSTLVCGPGTTRSGSQCVASGTSTVTCGSGTVLQGSTCVIAPTTGSLSQFLAQPNLVSAVHLPSIGGVTQRRLVLTELSQGNADAWARVVSPMIGNGRALHLYNYSSLNISTTPIYLTVDDTTQAGGGSTPRVCAAGLAPAPDVWGSKVAINLFSWSGGQATAMTCGHQGSIKAELAYQTPASTTLKIKLTINAVFSDGSTLVDHVLWF